jgi:hypothetical protein
MVTMNNDVQNMNETKTMIFTIDINLNISWLIKQSTEDEKQKKNGNHQKVSVNIVNDGNRYPIRRQELFTSASTHSCSARDPATNNDAPKHNTATAYVVVNWTVT